MKKSLIAAAIALAALSSAHAKDIVDTAVAAGSFKTLATALQAADVKAGKVKTDIAADNGVIHVIDSVIMPK